MFGSCFRTLAAILVSDFFLVSTAIKNKNKNLLRSKSKRGKKREKEKEIEAWDGEGWARGEAGKGGGRIAKGGGVK